MISFFQNLRFKLLLPVLILISMSTYLSANSNRRLVIPIKFCSQVPIASVSINGIPTNLIVDLGTSGFDLMLSEQIINKSGAKIINSDNKSFFTNYRR